MIIIVVIVGFIFLILQIKDVGRNTEYESWLEEDKAKYPELYKDD